MGVFVTGFIIRSFQVIAYVLFFLCIIGGVIYGIMAGNMMGYGDAGPMILGGILGLIGGFIAGVIYAGFLILMIDIRNTLREINSKA